MEDFGNIQKPDTPRPIDFMVRGVDLQTALYAIKHWHELTEEDKHLLGFTTSLDLKDRIVSPLGRC